MVRYIHTEYTSINLCYVEISCNSSDTKPTEDISTGSLCIEVDTGDVYLFDEETSGWNKMCSIKE